MLARRERAINVHFSTYSGRALNGADLVRSLLLDCFSSKEEREEAYDSLWLPIESRHGDGDPSLLEAFLKQFVAEQEGESCKDVAPRCAAVGAAPRLQSDESDELVTAGVCEVELATSVPLPDRVGALLRARGGANSWSNLYHASTKATDIRIVSARATSEAALSLLRDMHTAALVIRPAWRAPVEVRPRPVDLWHPDDQFRCMREADEVGSKME